MAFETGTFTNSHQLVHKILGFLADIGWSKHAVLQSDISDSDGYDIVFYSTGEDGNKDIYIRVAAGIGDKWTTTGDIQFPFDDGYTGYINGFAYQYYPSTGTSGADGYNELGVHGPFVYNSSPDDGDNYEYNMFSFGPANASRKRFIFDGALESTSFNANVGEPMCFDGKSKLWQGESSSFFFYVDLFDNTHTDRNEVDLGTWQTQHCPYIRNRDGIEYIYGNASQSDDTRRTQRYRISSNNYEGLAAPPFSITNTWQGAVVAGTKRKKFLNGEPMHRLLYWMAGRTSSNGTSQWAYFDAENNEWSGLISPGLPFTAGTNSFRPDIVYAPKEATGYEHDRVYMIRGSQGTEFVSIAIGDDGYVADASFTSHADTPYQQTTGPRIFYVGRAVFLQPGASGGSPSSALYRWAIPDNPTDTGTWELINDSFFVIDNNNFGSLFEVQYHLCNRARVTENATNTYWLFADLDRLIVVVKDATGSCNYIYTGLFESYLNTASATLLEDASVNTYSIKVSNPDLFTEGGKYLITDSTGQVGSLIEGGDKTTRLMAPSQILTVLGKNGNTLTVNRLASDYAAGAKIAEDPLPLMVRVHSMERAQTLNNISLDRGDDYTDPPYQAYRLSPVVSTTFTQAGDISERSDETLLFPIVLYEPGTTDIIGNEVRGQLKGIYATGTAISSEADVEVGSDTYVAFDIEESGETRRIVIGPK